MADTDVEAVVAQLAKTQVTPEKDEGVLSFAGHGLKLDSASDADQVVDAIKQCISLKILKLEGNTFGVEAAKAIAKALESHPELERALWKDMFTGRVKTEIPQALMFLSSGLMLAGVQLVELDLSDNAFGPVGVEGIAELLKSRTCYSLQELRLNNNGLGINGGKLLAKSLLDCHNNSHRDQLPLRLKTFICGRNRLENDGAKAIAEMIQTLGTLEEVQMPQNSIFHEGISALAKALEGNVNLRHLNLNDNIFTEDGAKAMSTALPKLQNLEIINLGDCLLKSEGGRILAKAFKNGHPKLKELYLGYNEFDYLAGKEIVESLQMKPLLEKLELNGNQFGEDGCEEIKTTLKDVGKLETLGSLSEDEGDDTKDEEEEGPNYDEDEKDTADNDSEPDDTDQERNEVILSLSPIKSTAAEFLVAPSAGRLLGLGNHRATSLIELISKDPRGVEKYIEAFIKVALVVRPESEELKQAAYECTDSLLSKGFREAEDTCTSSIFANTFLIYLGLIKSEDKSIKAPLDLSGTLTILEYAVRQPYFPRSTKEMLQLFLSSRFHDAIEKTGEIKHRLMQTLYQY